MELAVIGVLAIVGLAVFAVSRGKKAVRAYVYLMARRDGLSEGEANMVARRFDTNSAGMLNDEMLRFAKRNYGGQLAMISDARLDGFSE